MDKLKELVVNFIAKTQGKTPEEVSSLLFTKGADGAEVLKDDAGNQLFELDKGRIGNLNNKFETERKETYDKGYNKAKAEALSKYEQDQAAFFGIASDKKGQELWADIKVNLSKNSSSTEPTEEQIKRSPLYLNTVDQLKKEKSQIEKDWAAKFDTREKELQKKETFSQISKNALAGLKSLNPVLPPDEKVAAEWENIYLNKFQSYDYEIKDGKTIILQKDAEGNMKTLVDEHGHPVSFESLQKKIASSLFTFKNGEERGGTGNNNDNAGGKGGFSGPLPKSDDEYKKMVDELKDEKSKIELTQAWIASKNKQP